MLFVIFCIDRPDAGDKRRDTIQAHIDYVSGAGIDIVMSGPLVPDGGGAPIGSLFLVEAEDRAAVEAFQHADPLYQADIWETIEVRAFDKRVG